MITDDFLKFLDKSNKTIAIDFDGVIHNDHLGFHDGTIYGPPIAGAENALQQISSQYTIILYTCKANPNRPLVNDKKGIELIWEWLDKYNLTPYITDIMWGKPNAIIYIDDKGYRFNNWQDTLSFIKEVSDE
jgi:histidinol phosphatase-like enzyme